MVQAYLGLGTLNASSPLCHTIDMKPPNQDKAGLELVRRAGAYELALKSDKPANFKAAIKKINPIWASLPGSPYNQPAHTMAALWTAYQAALAKY